MPWGDITTKDSSLFLSVFHWPKDEKLYLPGLKTKLISANVLDGKDSRKIPFEQREGWTIFDIPSKPADLLVSVIELKLTKPAAGAQADSILGIYPNVSTELLAEFAEISGAEKKKISWMEKFGEWKNVNQVSKWEQNGNAVWTVEVFKPGYYQLALRYKGEGRLVWKISNDEGEIVQNQQAATLKYQDYPMGIMEFKKSGRHTIAVSLEEGNREMASLESLLIYPIK